VAVDDGFRRSIGSEGVKSLGDALKGNTTLTSLSLVLRGELSLVSLVTCVSAFPFVEVAVCATLHWLDCSKSIVEYHDQYYHVLSAIVAITLPTASPIGTGLLNSYLILSTRGVSVANGIGDEGGKVLGGALKDNTTLASLSLSLYGK
jgi:hypothetical protein